MVELEFILDQEKINVQVTLDELFSSAFTKYYVKSRIEPNSVIFMTRAAEIPGDKKISDIINEEEKKLKK